MGDLEVVVQEGDTPQLTGTGVCTLEGVGASFGPVDVALEGEIDGSDAWGTVSAAGSPGYPWGGAFLDVAPPTLVGSFVAEIVVEGFQVALNGTFEVVRLD